jgi:hypothetical protein
LGNAHRILGHDVSSIEVIAKGSYYGIAPAEQALLRAARFPFGL